MKLPKTLILIIVLIAFLSLATYWQFRNFRKAISENMPGLGIPQFEFSPVPSEEKMEEFISPDGKLKVEYGANWIKVKIESLEKILKPERGQALFFAQKVKLENIALAFLSIQELEIEQEETPEKIIEEMKKDSEEQGVETEILESSIETNQAIFEAKYKKQDLSLRSKEKILLGENKAYIIKLFTFEKDWKDFEEEIDEILLSAHLTQ